LIQLTGALLSTSNQLREQCARRLNQDFSSFLVVGQGGVESTPDEAQPGQMAPDRIRSR
jgi:hypothetical protein